MADDQDLAAACKSSFIVRVVSGTSSAAGPSLQACDQSHSAGIRSTFRWSARRAVRSVGSRCTVVAVSPVNLITFIYAHARRGRFRRHDQIPADGGRSLIGKTVSSDERQLCQLLPDPQGAKRTAFRVYSLTNERFGSDLDRLNYTYAKLIVEASRYKTVKSMHCRRSNLPTRFAADPRPSFGALPALPSSGASDRTRRRDAFGDVRRGRDRRHLHPDRVTAAFPGRDCPRRRGGAPVRIEYRVLAMEPDDGRPRPHLRGSDATVAPTTRATDADGVAVKAEGLHRCRPRVQPIHQHKLIRRSRSVGAAHPGLVSVPGIHGRQGGTDLHPPRRIHVPIQERHLRGGPTWTMTGHPYAETAPDGRGDGPNDSEPPTRARPVASRFGRMKVPSPALSVKATNPMVPLARALEEPVIARSRPIRFCGHVRDVRFEAYPAGLTSRSPGLLVAATAGPTSRRRTECHSSFGLWRPGSPDGREPRTAHGVVPTWSSMRRRSWPARSWRSRAASPTLNTALDAGGDGPSGRTEILAPIAPGWGPDPGTRAPTASSAWISALPDPAARIADAAHVQRIRPGGIND